MTVTGLRLATMVVFTRFYLKLETMPQF